MVFAHCMLYILILIDPHKALMYGGSLVITAFIYFFASLIASIVEQEFQNISMSLNQSKWYLLFPKERKMFVMIQMMSQKIKTIKVGPFGNASLERFTIVRQT